MEVEQSFISSLQFCNLVYKEYLTNCDSRQQLLKLQLNILNLVEFGYILQHQRKIAVHFLLLDNLLGISFLQPQLHADSHSNQVHKREQLQIKEYKTYGIVPAFIQLVVDYLGVAEFENFQELLASVNQQLFGTIDVFSVEKWADCLQHVDVEYNNNNAKYSEGDPTVFEQLKISRYASTIIFEIFHDIPGEPSLSFQFFESSTTWALNTINVILTRAHASKMYLSQLNIWWPFQWVVLLDILHYWRKQEQIYLFIYKHDISQLKLLSLFFIHVCQCYTVGDSKFLREMLTYIYDAVCGKSFILTKPSHHHWQNIVRIVIIIQTQKFKKMNNYHFYEEEAKGKFSVIFKARKKRKLDFVAIKRMQKTRKNKILNQAQILTELNHPNIIKFYEYIESKNHMWAVTEYCPGGDLLKLVEQDKALPETTVKGFLVDILKGLQYCHSKGVIVCDLKPASILINQYGSAKIGDFGSARNLVDLMHSQKQSKKGTPSYMAPQLFVNTGVYSIQSDLWSIGCIMYELSQGNPPFVSTSYQQIATLATTAKTPQTKQFSAEFNNLLQGLLMKDPEKRINWNTLNLHPWLANELKPVQMPEQPHFKQYLIKKQKQNNSNIKFLRASQQISKDSYANAAMNANDRRNQFVFQGDQTEDMKQMDSGDDVYGEQKFEIEEQQEQQAMKATAFMKKKQKHDGRVEKGKQKSPFQDSANVNLFLQLVSRNNLVPISDLINHQSDSAVKPIIGNKDIQIIQQVNFKRNGLGFAYIEPEVLAEGIVNGNMDQELKAILDGMFGQHKQNVIGYFESIIQNSDIANYLFKENFIKYYMQIVKNYKKAELRAKMFEIMGFLVRHATVIQPGVIKQGIITLFVEGATKDKSEKVRRKAMAALGQILFYGATQVDEGVPQWDLSLNLIHTLQKIIKNTQEDEIVRIYCCKSIENITAQAKDVGTKFAQIDTLMALIFCFNTCRNEGFRTSICCSFHHIVQLNSSLRQILLEKLGSNNMIQALKQPDLSSKSLQIILWVLITQFIKTKTSKISKLYLQDENLFRHIIQRLDRTTSSVAKGRIYLYIYYYLETDPKKSLTLLQNNNHIITINNNKLFNILQKQHIAQDKQNKYELQCLHYILVWLQQNYHHIIKYIHEDIKQIVVKIENGYQVNNKKNIGYCGILWHMINSNLFEDLFCVQANLQMLFSLLGLFDSISVKVYQLSQQENSYANILEQIKSIYMQILQKLTNNTSISEKLQQYYSNKILPLIVGRILKSQHQDIKFNCIKFLLYLISFYMNQDFLYDSTILNTTSNKITSLINVHFLPEIDGLISKNNNQAVPTMIIKLLVVLFDIHVSFVKRFHQLGKIQVILNNGYFQEGANSNVLKLVQKYLTVQPVVTKSVPEWVMRVFVMNGKIMAGNLANGQELLLEHSLEIFRELMRINGKNWRQEDIDNIWQKVLPLQGHEDLIIRQKAENLVNSILESGRFGSKGKWQVKQKKGIQNYQKYLQISGKQKDPKILQNTNKSTHSRYN